MAETKPTDLEDIALKVEEEVERAYSRYAKGLQALATVDQARVGQTPKDVIWTLNKAKLYRYHSRVPAERRYPVPLLLVYALINKPYILDLRPGNSFVEYMVGQGFDVYLLDWGVPGPEDKHLKFDDYALEYIPRAVRQVLKTSPAQEFSILGYCIGSTIVTLYAATRTQAPIRNIILLTAPLDFSSREASVFSVWLDERYLDVDKMVDTFGNIPAEVIDLGSKLLKPVENFLGAYTSLFDRVDDPEAVEAWQTMNKWVNDGVPFAGEAFRQWVKEFYRENKLVKGELEIRGQRVDLRNIQAAFLNVIAERDHIVPPPQSRSIVELVSSQDKETITIPGGHIGIMAGRGAINGLWPKISDWLMKRSQV